MVTSATDKVIETIHKIESKKKNDAGDCGHTTARYTVCCICCSPCILYSTLMRIVCCPIMCIRGCEPGCGGNMMTLGSDKCLSAYIDNSVPPKHTIKVDDIQKIDKDRVFDEVSAIFSKKTTSIATKYIIFDYIRPICPKNITNLYAFVQMQNNNKNN